MAKTELDWTFDSIPFEGEAVEPRRPAAPTPGPPASPRRVPRWHRGWLLAGLLSALALVGLGAYLFYSYGWQRVERQLAQEVAYEDGQALAGNADAVLALQWPDNPAWLQARRAEVRLGWPARPPADDLLLDPTPAEILAYETLAANQVAVTVLRTASDAAGQHYAFEYVQHYRSVGPGLWRRMAPAGLEATATWTGRRLVATFPEADAPWLEPLLPRVDGYLNRACADWGCPAAFTAPLSYTARLEDVPGLAPLDRPAPNAAAPYPAAFDLIFRNPRFPRRLILPSLHLSGRPHDPAAQAALVRSTTVSLLAYTAAELSQTARSSRGDYLDALIARAEIRLGLSSAPAWSPQPGSYLPPGSLWPYSSLGESHTRRPPLAGRQQALAFLNWAIADRPPLADAALLRQLRFQNRLDEWLTNSLAVDGSALVTRWDAEIAAHFAAEAPPRWAELDGLAYLCNDGAWLVRGGQPVPLPVDSPSPWLPRDALSPDGLFLAVLEASTAPVSRLRVYDLAASTSVLVPSEGLGLPLGWSAEGDLLYLTQAEGPFSPAYSYELRLYNPRTQQAVGLGAEPLVSPWGYEQSWSADRRLLAITLVWAEAVGGQLLVSPGLIAFRAPLQALRLPAEGYAAALAPDGQRLAYVAGQVSAEHLTGTPRGIEIVHLDTQAVYGLLEPGLPGQPEFHDLNQLAWSPDGRRLAFMDYDAGSGARLYTLFFSGGDPAAGAELEEVLGPLPQLALVGFSADSRFLAAEHYDQQRSEVLVYDQRTGHTAYYLGGGSASRWSPAGHLLALASPAGVYVINTETGRAQWVRAGACEVGWFRLPG